MANLSGGKDGQVMFKRLLEVVPQEQLLAVHATFTPLQSGHPRSL